MSAWESNSHVVAVGTTSSSVIKELITTDLSEEEMRPIRFLVGNLDVSDSIRTICSAKAADKAVSDSFRLAVSAALISFIFVLKALLVM